MTDWQRQLRACEWRESMRILALFVILIVSLVIIAKCGH